MASGSTLRTRVSRRQALVAVILPAGAVALLSACGGAAVGTATTPTSASQAALSAATLQTSAPAVSSSQAANSVASSTSMAASPTSTSSVQQSITSTVATQPAAAAPTKGGNTIVAWTNAGYRYKGLVGAHLVSEFAQQGGPAIEYNDTSKWPDLIAVVAAGTPPDLSFTDRYVTQSYASRGIISPMDDMLGRSKVVKKDMFFGLLVDNTNYHGKTYGIPQGPDVGLLYYNKISTAPPGLIRRNRRRIGMAP